MAGPAGHAFRSDAVGHMDAQGLRQMSTVQLVELRTAVDREIGLRVAALCDRELVTRPIAHDVGGGMSAAAWPGAPARWHAEHDPPVAGNWMPEYSAAVATSATAMGGWVDAPAETHIRSLPVPSGPPLQMPAPMGFTAVKRWQDGAQSNAPGIPMPSSPPAVQGPLRQKRARSALSEEFSPPPKRAARQYRYNFEENGFTAAQTEAIQAICVKTYDEFRRTNPSQFAPDRQWREIQGLSDFRTRLLALCESFLATQGVDADRVFYGQPGGPPRFKLLANDSPLWVQNVYKAFLFSFRDKIHDVKYANDRRLQRAQSSPAAEQPVSAGPADPFLNSPDTEEVFPHQLDELS